MKNKRLFSFIALLLLFSSALYSQQHAQYGFYDKYYIAACDNGRQHDFSILNSLNMNLWMHYNIQYANTQPGKEGGWIDFYPQVDLLHNDFTVYRDVISNVLINNGQHNYRTAGERPKISYLVTGQRSDYQCEQSHIDPYYDFYAFENHNSYDNDYQETGHGAAGHWVRHCGDPANSVPPHEVVSGLLANREQADVINVCNSYQNDCWNTFIVKPKIRIPQSFVIPANYETPVCRIKVYSWDGITVIKDVTILAKYFLDPQTFQYDGSYLETYFNGSAPVNMKINEFPDGIHNPFNPNKIQVTTDGCNIDYTVDWLGACEMWIDYIRVDDDKADRLLSGYYDDPNHPENEWIKMEAKDMPDLSGDNQLKFYFEEFFFNSIPCIKYLNQRIRAISGNKYSIMVDINNGEYYKQHRKYIFSAPEMTPDYVKRTLIDEANLDEIFTFSYPLEGYFSPSQYYHNEVDIPSTLPIWDYNENEGRYATPKDPEVYDTWLQNYLDRYNFDGWNNLMTQNYKFADRLSKLCNKPFVNLLQTHLWFVPSGNVHEPAGILREPTNEEMEMMANVSVTYGAKAQMWFEWMGFGNVHDLQHFIQRGFTGSNSDELYDENYIRHQNVYGQYNAVTGTRSKFNKIGEINRKLNTIGNTLLQFGDNDDSRHSYIYRLENERNDLISHSCFSDIITWKPGSGYPPCVNLSPHEQLPPGEAPECLEQRYLQAATFKKAAEQTSAYFMLVNRRCSPFFYPGEDPRFPNGENGGKRYITIRFNGNSTDLTGAVNWNVVDVATRLTVASFDKNSNKNVWIDYLMPGEGKLYQLVPTVKGGGTLLADENISGESFTCLDTVWNNGHNITFGANTHISFTDSSKIIMNGGVFTSGDVNVNSSQNITSDAVSNNHWFGYDFSNTAVHIYNASFSGIANDTTYAVNIINCPVVDIRGCTFDCGNDNIKGAVRATYIESGDVGAPNIYIGGNTFNINNSGIPDVDIISYSSTLIPLLIENNIFTGSSVTGSTAIMLSGVTGGALKSNTFTNLDKSVTLLSSSIDFAENIINTDVSGSKSIETLAGSEIKMNPAGGLVLGGKNEITNTGSNSKNIFTDNSYFLIDKGENVFSLNESTDCYHLNGWFPDDASNTTSATDNCFKVNLTPTNPAQYISLGENGSPISFNFTPFLTGCEPPPCTGGTVAVLGGGINDTMCTSSGGGGESGTTELLPLSKGELEGVYNKTTPTTARRKIILSPRQIYDTVCVLMRYRNYTTSKTKCYDLLNTYPDSIQSLNAISKLYLAVSASDTTTAGRNILKTFYETLILNNSGNVPLINRCIYYVQKCKVLLRQYSSALTGFQSIIYNNPYNYEGLVARWDYMATSLLMNGGGGGENSITNYELGITDESDKSDKFEEYDNLGDDKSPFTKDQKTVIKTAIINAVNITKTKTEEKIAILTKLANDGNADAKETVRKLKALKETIKTHKPVNITEHIRIVSGDVVKIFGNITKSGSKNGNNNIPMIFSLSQNYPNPFNPVTTIKYALPKDVKVVIKIYDILGQEVKTIVNEFQKTGYYDTKFDGSNVASGIYFYRIEAGDFSQSKKMVLVK